MPFEPHNARQEGRSAKLEAYKKPEETIEQLLAKLHIPRAEPELPAVTQRSSNAGIQGQEEPRGDANIVVLATRRADRASVPGLEPDARPSSRDRLAATGTAGELRTVAESSQDLRQHQQRQQSIRCLLRQHPENS
jgi:hypothetical protein